MRQDEESADLSTAEPELRSVPELLRSERHAVVVGEPGTGKSTLLQRVVRESANWWLAAPPNAPADAAPFGAVMPVRVPASFLVGTPLREAMAASLNAEIGMHLDSPLAPDHFSAPPLPGAEWLVLVDGVDEIMDTRLRTALIAALAVRLGDQESPFRFLVTSRPLPHHELASLRLANIGEWRLRSFDQKDLESFAGAWFRARGRADVDLEVRTFLDRVERSNLRAIIRIPLLAAITVVVHEHSPEPELPIGQAALYRDFLRYLLQVRQESVRVHHELRARLQRYTPAGDRLADWLFEHVGPLLQHLATDLLAGAAESTQDSAARWVAERLPDLPRFVPDWTDRVTDLLRGTGVLLQQADGTLRFLHHSFAEYLAAGPAAEQLDPIAWRRMVVDPARRNHALFTLARWTQQPGHDPTTLVQPLLRHGDDEDLLAVAAVLAHGVRLSASTETEVVERLLGAARGSFGGDFFGALKSLPGWPQVTNGLAEMMASSLVAVDTKVQAARCYASLANPEPAVTALAGIAGNAVHPVVSRVGAAQALADLGESATAVQALSEITNDIAAPVPQRVTAARLLANHGEATTAIAVLSRIAQDPTVNQRDRCAAMIALGELGEHDQAQQLLTGIMDDPNADRLARIWAAEAMVKQGRSDKGIAALISVAQDPEHAAYQRCTAAARLAQTDHRSTGIAILEDIGRDSTRPAYERLSAAERLADIGEHAKARGILIPITRQSLAYGWDKVRAAQALAHAGDRDTAIRILLHLARSPRTTAATQTSAARELAWQGKRPDAIKTLRRIVRSRHRAASNRAYAAQALASCGDLSHARAALLRIARAWHITANARVIAASQLAELGEREQALSVLRRIVHRRFVSAHSKVRAAEELANLGEWHLSLAVLRHIAARPGSRVTGYLARAEAAEALAERCELLVALDTLHDMVRIARSNADRVWAAAKLAEIGDRDGAQRELTSIVLDPSAIPDHRLKAAQAVSSEWGPSLAMALLNTVAQKRTLSTRTRIRAAMDVAKIHDRKAATATLRAMTTNQENALTRLTATAVLLYFWALRRVQARGRRH
ncbi:ATP-binding protein [Kibdelosporangium aridum]|uniref:ATP-binding protein n=1 Tax=Kibdelosporangium aridum TaxID=2030 RepID=A0A428ZCH3_KIBAR|nr:ATP-binding protein [Kibdelosporangium aridum]RSM85746.1 ATP-binding protein [Kibdelosporangium aridum]